MERTNKTEVVKARVKPDMKAQLDELVRYRAERDLPGASESAILCEAIRQFLAAHAHSTAAPIVRLGVERLAHPRTIRAPRK